MSRLFPALAWLRGYSRDDLTADGKAGLIVGVLVVPQAMAYAALAGVPPTAGLYAAMVSLVVYAAFGTSRYISVGPVALDSLLTAAAVAPLANGDAGRYVLLASALAVMVGLIQVTAGLIGLGALVNFISVPVVTGFTSAAALTIALSQLKDLLGVSVTGGATTFVDAVRSLAPAISDTKPLTVLLAVVAIALLVGLRRWAPNVPAPLVVVVSLTAVVAALGWSDRVTLVGAIAGGLPTPSWPGAEVSDLRALLPSAAVIALVSYLESISTGQAFARRTRTHVEPDAELVAVGLANTSSGLMQGIPVAGGFSRGAVNFQAGARTPMSGVVAAGLVVVTVLIATPLLERLPKVALAAIIVVAVSSLIDVKGAWAIWRIRRSDLLSLAVAFVATLILGPAPGLLTGVGISLLLFLRHSARPHMPELGLKVDDGAYRNRARHDVVVVPGLVVLRIDAPLSFTGARPIAERIAEVVRGRPDTTRVVIDCSAINTADFTGIEMLSTLRDELDAAGVALHLAALRGPVRDILRRDPAYSDWAPRIHPTVPAAVTTLTR